MSRNNPNSWFCTFLNHWTGPLLFFFCLSFSIATLPRDLVWGDSPELAACAWILGVPHPTGYPLYMLLTRLFQAIPLGTVLFRAHLFSAVCSALAAWVLFHFLRQILRTFFENRTALTTLPALAAALAWTLTPIVWTQSRIAEVYALFALQFALALWLFVRSIQHSNRTLPWLALLLGTMLVHHRLSIFLIALIGLFLVLRVFPRTSAWFISDWANSFGSPKPFYQSISCFLLPLTLLAYLPLRALSNPTINWYDPDSPHRFYQLIGGQLYAGTLTQSLSNLLQSSIQEILSGFLYLLMLPFLCFNILFIPILWGIWILYRRIPWFALFTILLFTIYQTFVFVYRVGDWPVFLIPSLILLTIPLAFGIAGFLDILHRPTISKSILYLAMGFFLFTSILPLWVRFEEEGGIMEYPFALSNYTLSNGAWSERMAQVRDNSARIYADTVWGKIPNGSPIITGLTYETADNELYPLLYQQIVENRNPDSTLIGAGFLHLDWYRDQISQKLSLDLPPNRDRIYSSREVWLETVWNEIVAPLIQKGPVYTTSFSLTSPPPSSWMKRADFQYLGMIAIDRQSIPPYYAPYIPGGHLYKISQKESPPSGAQP